jgi:hypothetical protein
MNKPARKTILTRTFAVAVVGTIMLGAMANAQEAQPMPAQLCSMARQLHIEKQCELRNTSATITPPLSRPVTLIDGKKLLELCIKHEVGVKRRPVEIYEIDEAFLR